MSSFHRGKFRTPGFLGVMNRLDRDWAYFTSRPHPRKPNGGITENQPEKGTYRQKLIKMNEKNHSFDGLRMQQRWR